MSAPSSTNALNLSNLSRGQISSLACLYEVTAPKPGNVHRGADFEDMTFFDFVTSAIAIASAMDAAPNQSLGQTILTAVRATQASVAKNTNLGIILLIAPLATVPDDVPLQDGVSQVLNNLTSADAATVYQAIRLAGPGGMGQADQQDLNETTPEDLIEAMRLAESRDHIAYQYANDFETVFDDVLPDLITNSESMSLSAAIVHAHVQQMARTPDTLIRRKCGKDIADRSATLASLVTESGTPQSDSYQSSLADLDFWLRSDGHRRNPGTTADLIAAALYVGLHQGTFAPDL